MIYAHFDCDFQDVHNSFPANSSQTIQISFPSSVPWLFELEKQWVKKYVEPSMVCSSLKLRHLAHFFLVGRLWECLNTYEIVYQRLLGSFWMQVFLISDIFFQFTILKHIFISILYYIINWNDLKCFVFGIRLCSHCEGERIILGKKADQILRNSEKDGRPSPLLLSLGSVALLEPNVSFALAIELTLPLLLPLEVYVFAPIMCKWTITLPLILRLPGFLFKVLGWCIPSN